MSDTGGVSVQLPSDPLQKSTHAVNSTSSVPSQTEADLYSKLKKLERELEFLSLQEVLLFCHPTYDRNTSKTSSEV
jgi:hypothetical protein